MKMDSEVFKPSKAQVYVLWSQVVTSQGVDQFSEHEWQEIFMDFCKCVTCPADPFIGMDKVGELANDLLSSGPQYLDTPRPAVRSATSVPFKTPTQPQYVSWREQRMASHSHAISTQPMQNRRYPSVRVESTTFSTPSAFQTAQFKPTMSNAEFFKQPPPMPQRQIPPPPTQQLQSQQQQTRLPSQQIQNTPRQQTHTQPQPHQRFYSVQQTQQQQRAQQQLLQQQQRQHQQLANQPASQMPQPPSPKKPRLDACQPLTTSQLSELQRRRAVNFVPDTDAAKKNETAAVPATSGTEKPSALPEIAAPKPADGPVKKSDPLEDWLKSYPDKTASELVNHVGDTDKFFESLPSASLLMEKPSVQEVASAPVAAALTAPAAVPAAAEVVKAPPLAAEVTVDNVDNEKKKSKKKKSKKSKNEK